MDGNDVFKLLPRNHDHGAGLVEALGAVVARLEACAGASFIANDEEVARALREVAVQFRQQHDRIRNLWVAKSFDAEFGITETSPEPRTKEPRRESRRG